MPILRSMEGKYYDLTDDQPASTRSPARSSRSCLRRPACRSRAARTASRPPAAAGRAVWSGIGPPAGQGGPPPSAAPVVVHVYAARSRAWGHPRRRSSLSSRKSPPRPVRTARSIPTGSPGSATSSTGPGATGATGATAGATGNPPPPPDRPDETRPAPFAAGKQERSATLPWWRRPRSGYTSCDDSMKRFRAGRGTPACRFSASETGRREIDMDTRPPAPQPHGVGISYHPFLHDALLAHADAFDFFELPLDFTRTRPGAP